MNKMFLFGLHVKACVIHWKLIARETVICFFMWGSYFMSVDMNMAGFSNICFWLAVISSCTSLLTTSLRSILPAIFAWLLVAPMYFLGLTYAMQVTLLIANTALIIHLISYACFGERFINSNVA